MMLCTCWCGCTRRTAYIKSCIQCAAGNHSKPKPKEEQVTE